MEHSRWPTYRRRADHLDDPVSALSFSREGNRLASAGDRGIQVWNWTLKAANQPATRRSSPPPRRTRWRFAPTGTG